MGLYQNILNDPIAELDLRELIVVQPGATCREAVAQMRLKRLGYVLVLDPDGKPVGIFTERQLIRLLLNGPHALDDPVQKHLTPDALKTLRRDEPIATLVEKLRQADWRFVCVVDERGRAVGITGQRGLMEYIVEHFPRQIKVQMMKSKLFMDQREGA